MADAHADCEPRRLRSRPARRRFTRRIACRRDRRPRGPRRPRPGALPRDAGRAGPARGAARSRSATGRRTGIEGFRQAVAHGIAYLPRDRRATGIFPTLSILDNFAISTVGRDVRVGLISKAAPARALRGLPREAVDRRAAIRMRRSPRCRAATSRRCCSPAALALRAPLPAAQRPDPRRRHRDAACPLRRVPRARRRGHGAGHPVQRDRGDRRALPPRARLPRERAVARRISGEAMTSERGDRRDVRRAQA